jgi:hypothetical protein
MATVSELEIHAAQAEVDGVPRKTIARGGLNS